MADNTAFKIESNDLAISELFKDFFRVPYFQREYVWKQEHVEKLLYDVLDEFYDETRQPVEGPEYFLGSIIACKDDEGIFQLIDGQQRMTTIYLILCAARDAIQDAGGKPPDWLQNKISDVYSNPRTGDDIKRHRLTLQYEDSDHILKKIVTTEGNISSLPEKTESIRRIISSLPEKTESVRRIKSAYETIREFFTKNLQDEQAQIQKFLVAFTDRIKLIRILTPTMTNALKVFETINNRGVSLNAMDLLKNLLFMQTGQQGYPALESNWKSLIDVLEQCEKKPLRFLRYYIMSHHTIKYNRAVREDEIFDWFRKNTKTCKIDTDPLGFTQELIECAHAHANFLSSKDSQGNDNRYLKNLALLGRSLRQQHILLLAGRHLPAHLFEKLCQSIENLFFCYIIAREPTRTFERNFTKWSSELRIVKDESTLDDFLKKYFVTDMRDMTGRFEFEFQELTTDIPQYRMRYILAKLTQHIEEGAWGSQTHGQIERYTDKSVHVEHILPQTPTDEIRDGFDKLSKYDDYRSRLGNLTLLEETINTSISNDSYQNKLPGYRQSSFLLTKSLAEVPEVGADTQLNRAVSNLISFDEWTSESIERRQKMLTDMAHTVWNMPKPLSEQS